MTRLFDPIQIGAIAAANRIAMAPLTRNRAAAHQVPTDLMATYYRQRASAGLIIAEATQISAEGQGYLDTPGIYSPEQVAGWKKVTDAVHAAGGKIVLQLWHVGRISHVSLQPGGISPVSSTARVAKAQTFTKEGFVDVSPPRALRTDEMPRLVADYRHAAKCAIQAGFDGVEVHGANGYLIDQFLRDSTNDRTDAYGGSVANRARLLLEVLQAVTEEGGLDGVLLLEGLHAVREGLVLELIWEVLRTGELHRAVDVRIHVREVLRADGGEHRLDVSLGRRDVMAGEFAGDLGRIVGQLGHGSDDGF